VTCRCTAWSTAPAATTLGNLSSRPSSSDFATRRRRWFGNQFSAVKFCGEPLRALFSFLARRSRLNAPESEHRVHRTAFEARGARDAEHSTISLESDDCFGDRRVNFRVRPPADDSGWNPDFSGADVRRPKIVDVTPACSTPGPLLPGCQCRPSNLLFDGGIHQSSEIFRSGGLT
jgi:hypothetical protein